MLHSLSQAATIPRAAALWQRPWRRRLCSAASAGTPHGKGSGAGHVVWQLRRRGLVQDITSEAVCGQLLDEAAPRVAVYAGFDPTADSLHIGNLVSIMALAHFQRAGHTAIAVLGGATGLIGDPSGKSRERPLMDQASLDRNIRHIDASLRHCLRFGALQVLDNSAWYGTMNVVEFLRSVGKHFRINAMLAKDSVRLRLARPSNPATPAGTACSPNSASDVDESASKTDEAAGMSFTEFSYSLLQGYDFLHLFRTHGCRVQVGGTDQWGNITAGCDLIRRVTGSGDQVLGLTLPLLTTATGEKLGKSEGNSVWLAAHRTSPYEFYQYFFRTEDADLERCLKIFTFLSLEDIQEAVAAHKQAPENRAGQRLLAKEVTTIVHGEHAAARAIRASEVLFGNKGLSSSEASVTAAELLEVFKNVPSISVSAAQLAETDLLGFAVKTGLSKSRAEGKRLISSGGLYLNNERVTANGPLQADTLIDGRLCFLRAGKKDYRLINLEKV